MLRFLGRRAFTLIPMWVAVAFLTFLLMYLIPGDPLVSILGPDASPEVRARMLEEMHLDEPFFARFFLWARAALRGDLGSSIFLDRPVAHAIWERAPITLSLGAAALVWAVLIGLPLGILAAVRRGTGVDTGVMVLSLVGLSTPEFLFGLVGIFTLGVRLGWLPVGGYVAWAEAPWQTLRHLFLPSFTLGFINAALIARMTRATMIEILQQDYIRTARAKGVHEAAVLRRHALRIALIPVSTVIGFAAVLIVAGAFITEIVFTLPGMGNLAISAVLQRDYPLVQGVMLVIATGVLLLNLLVDVGYAYLDPRIRYG